MEDLLRGAADRAITYLTDMGDRPVRPDPGVDLTLLGGPLPEESTEPEHPVGAEGG